VESAKRIHRNRHPGDTLPRQAMSGRNALEGFLASIGFHALAVCLVLGAATAGRIASGPTVIDLALVSPETTSGAPTGSHAPERHAAVTPRSAALRPVPPAPRQAAVARAPRAEPGALKATPETVPRDAAGNADGGVLATHTAPADTGLTGIPSALRAEPFGHGAEAAPSAAPGGEAVAGTARGAEPFPGGGNGSGLPLEAGNGDGSPGRAYGSIRSVIQRGVSYPALARRMGWEGRVIVAFRILSNGSVRDIRVVEGSGHAVLDRSAVEAVRSASPFPPLPAPAEVVTPVVYKLY
jgi:protein TonB